MPKKLMDCVERVKKSGKSESEAWAICVSSTGLKPHKEKKGELEMLTKEQVTNLITVANRLDAAGLHKEADDVDTLVREAGVGDFLKKMFQGIKKDRSLEGAYQSIFKSMQKATSRLRQQADVINGVVADLETAVSKPNLVNIKRWSDRAAQLDNAMSVSLKEIKSVQQINKQFEDLAQKAQAVAEGKMPAEEMAAPQKAGQPAAPATPAAPAAAKPGEAPAAAQKPGEAPAAKPAAPAAPATEAPRITQEQLSKGYSGASPEVKQQIHKLLGIA